MGSTTRIHTLAPFVANRIAAGEVVERTASILQLKREHTLRQVLCGQVKVNTHYTLSPFRVEGSCHRVA